MALEARLAEAAKRLQFDPPALLKTLGLALTGIGLIGFVAALLANYDAAWRAYLTNLTYWVGLAEGALIWSVILRITNARWGRSLMRLWEGAAFFLPIAFLLFLGLIVGGLTSHIYPWAHHPIAHKETWLAPGFVFGREFVFVVALFGLSLLYVYWSLKLDVGVVRAHGGASPFYERLFAKATGDEAERERVLNGLKRLSPALALLYGLLMSLFAFDLIMSLEPYWYSTMFGGYYFSGNLLMGMAFVGLVAGLVRKRGLLENYIGKNQFWDVGKLTFAFTMFWTYLMWSQYLPIWYGNMHEEVGYVLKRTEGAYEAFAYAVLALVWVIPWWILLPKATKQRPLILGTAAVIVLVGMWLERWLLVVPSQFDVAPVAADAAVFPGWIEVVTTCFFGGLFVLAYDFFLKRIPILPVGDPVFHHVLEHGSHGHH